MRYVLDEQEKRPTIPPPAPEAKDVLEAVTHTHTKIDAIAADVATLRGGNAALHAKLDRIVESLHTIQTGLLRDAALERRIERLEKQLAAAE